MTEPCGRGTAATPPTPMPIDNRAGLTTLAYRVGTHPTFLAAMKARLADPKRPALQALKTREANDPAIALLDAWAVVGDILTFYQERIANEGYLGTATERRSVLELARLVGSSLRPGVSASTHLAYSLEQNSTATIPGGSRAQSMPVQGQLPQTFETSEDLPARAAWNNLVPRLTRPQIVEPEASTIYVVGITSNLKPNDPVLIVASPPKLRRVAALDVEAPQNRTKVTLQYIPPAAEVPAPQLIASDPEPEPGGDETERLAAPETPLSSIVTLAAAITKSPGEIHAEPLRREAQTPAPVTDAVPRVLKTFIPQAWPQLYTAWKNATSVAPTVPGEVHALRIQAAPFGHNAPLRPITNKRGLVIGTEEWPLDVVTISIAVSAQSAADAESREISIAHMEAFVRGEKPKALVKITRGAQSASAEFDLSDAMSITHVASWTVESQFTRHNHTMEFRCPDFQSRFEIALDQRRARAVVTIDHESPIVVPAGQTATSSAVGRRTTVSNLAGISILDESAIAPERLDVIELDAAYDHIVPGSWIAIIRPDRGDPIGEPLARLVTDVKNVSVARYGMTGRVTQLTLDDVWLFDQDRLLSVVRNVTVAAQSERLSLAEEPIETPIAGDEIELGDLYAEIPLGRRLIVTGERMDLPDTSGVTGTELVVLAGLEHRVQVEPPPSLAARPGERTHSFLKLESTLAHEYKRDTVTIYGNVARATHGETRMEVLGSGDGSQAIQTFTLHQAPLTRVSAATRTGTASTLEVRVNDILWHEMTTLADAGPSDRCYVTRTDDADKTIITFGDGIHGMRLPTGRENVRAVYRSGIGSVGNLPAGAINQLGSRPFGVKAVVGPLAATGGVDREGREEGKSSVPLAAFALDRLVGVQNHAAFARTFAGIGKACAVELSNGVQPFVFVTVAGADGALIDRKSDHFQNLLQAFREFGDPHLPVQVDVCELLLLVIAANVSVLGDYQWNAVEPRIRSVLNDVFGFARRDLGQSVALSEVISVIQSVPGVAYVDVDVLDSVSREDAESPDRAQQKMENIAKSKRPSERVYARLVGPVTGAPLPAQLAFLSPNVPETLILNEIGS